jgi:uncharacterized protein
MADVAPRWLADEMLGRLARYLRFFGHDVEYLRSVDDPAITRRALAEHRTLLTRDRALARKTPGSVLLHSSEIGEQLREVRKARPEARYELAFDRCPGCNTRLSPWSPDPHKPWPPELPRERVEHGLAVVECPGCGRHYWEGSHAAEIRRKVSAWLADPPNA